MTLNNEEKIDPDKFLSKGKNTPFGGWTCKGWPVTTIVNGKVAWRKGRVKDEKTIDSRRWNYFYWRRHLGADTNCVGEVVFNTGMTGYQEVLSDPSYCGQIVTLTYPLIGNYGINRDDFESITPAINGFIVKEVADFPSNWRNEHIIG